MHQAGLTGHSSHPIEFESTPILLLSAAVEIFG